MVGGGGGGGGALQGKVFQWLVDISKSNTRVL